MPHTFISCVVTCFNLISIASCKNIHYMILVLHRSFSRMLRCFRYSCRLDSGSDILAPKIIVIAVVFENHVFMRNMHHIKLLLPRLNRGALSHSTHLGVFFLVWLEGIRLPEGRNNGRINSCHHFYMFRFDSSLRLFRHQIIEELVIHLLDEFKITILGYVVFREVLFENKRQLTKLKPKQFFLAII